MEIPRDIEFREELPKTLIGKLSKKELIKEEKARRSANQNDMAADPFSKESEQA
jgi:long-chain acyl-CoA synthetase